MKTVKMDVTLEKNPGRMELFIRIVWCAICAFVLYLFSIIGGLCCFVQWIYVLILGKRMDALDPWIIKIVKGSAKLSAYASLLTDERPPLVPED